MSSVVSPASTLDMPADMPPNTPTPSREPGPRLSGDLLLYLVLALLVLGAWWVTQAGWFEAGDDVGYWIGVAGGSMMLALFSYPLRKYLRFMHRWGKVKWWFWVHMALGIGGPVLILLHSTFRIGSLNAAVALVSMIVVALSGVVGRFLHVRVHRGLRGEITTLGELRQRAGFVQSEARSKLHFAPTVEARLLAFEQQVLAPDTQRHWSTALRLAFALPWRQWQARRACVADLRIALRALAGPNGWTADDLARRERLARKLVRRYLAAVVKVAQFSAYERLFALWHVAHVPFVYLLVISAIVHVLAVHMY